MSLKRKLLFLPAGLLLLGSLPSLAQMQEPGIEEGVPGGSFPAEPGPIDSAPAEPVPSAEPEITPDSSSETSDDFGGTEPDMSPDASGETSDEFGETEGESSDGFGESDSFGETEGESSDSFGEPELGPDASSDSPDSFGGTEPSGPLSLVQCGPGGAASVVTKVPAGCHVLDVNSPPGQSGNAETP